MIVHLYRWLKCQLRPPLVVASNILTPSCLAYLSKNQLIYPCIKLKRDWSHWVSRTSLTITCKTKSQFCFQCLVGKLLVSISQHATTCHTNMLRIPDRYDAKIAKNLRPLDILACNSANKPSFTLPTDHFTVAEHLKCSIGQKGFVAFWKDGLLAELPAWMSRGCIFLHHNYQVSLRNCNKGLDILNFYLLTPSCRTK